jgi:hypothetical protein
VDNDKPNLGTQESYYASPPYSGGSNVIYSPATIPTPTPTSIAEKSSF